MENFIDTRRSVYSKKWARYENLEMLPFWIADMDLKSPDFLIDDLVSRVQKNFFGYTDIPQEVTEGIIYWYHQRYGIELDEQSIMLSTGVLHSYTNILETCISKKGKIIVFTPLYPPLMKIAEKLCIEVIELSLLRENDFYRIDFLQLEHIITRDQFVEAVVFCNPHNPVGRVWQASEISEVQRIVNQAGVLLISDEIHGDLVFSQHQFFSVLHNKQVNDKAIVLSSPAKTFNVAGIKASYIITENPILQKKLQQSIQLSGIADLSLFSIETLYSLYTHFEEANAWLNEVVKLLEANFDYLESCLSVIPRCRLTKAEASYLAWIEIIDSPCQDADEMRYLLKKDYKIDLHEGTIFHGESDNFLRLNFGCPREMLEKGIEQLVSAINHNVI